MHRKWIAVVALVAVACGDGDGTGPTEPEPPEASYVNVSGVFSAQVSDPIPVSEMRSCPATEGEERPAYVHDVEVGLYDEKDDPEAKERVYVSVRRATEGGDCWYRALYWGQYRATEDSILPTEWTPSDAVGMRGGAWVDLEGRFEAPVVQAAGRVLDFEVTAPEPSDRLLSTAPAPDLSDASR